MAYEVAVSMVETFAAIAPVEGSVHRGFYQDNAKNYSLNTNQTISVMDVHGIHDPTITANKSITDDFFVINTVADNMDHW